MREGAIRPSGSSIVGMTRSPARPLAPKASSGMSVSVRISCASHQRAASSSSTIAKDPALARGSRGTAPRRSLPVLLRANFLVTALKAGGAAHTPGPRSAARPRHSSPHCLRATLAHRGRCRSLSSGGRSLAASTSRRGCRRRSKVPAGGLPGLGEVAGRADVLGDAAPSRVSRHRRDAAPDLHRHLSVAHALRRLAFRLPRLPAGYSDPRRTGMSPVGPPR